MTEADRDPSRVFLLAFTLGLTTLAFILAKTGRDALFFQGGGGLQQLPLIYINVAAASLPLALIFVKAMKTWGARPARVGILSLAAAVMAVAAPYLRPGDNALLVIMFMFIPAIFGVVFASLWLLTSDVFEKTEKREAARAFSKIGAGTLAGGMLGGIISKALASLLDVKWLIFLSAVIIGAVIALVAYIHAQFPTNVIVSKADEGKKKAGLLAPLMNKYSMTLVGIAMTGAVAGVLIDFQFYAAAASANMGSKGNASFFANFYILLNLSSLLLQLFGTPKIQDKAGLRGGLMVLPIALIGGATFATAAATAVSRSVLRVTEGGLRSSVHRSLWEQAFILVDSADRSSVKIAVDGVAARIAEVLGALAILVWIEQVAMGGVIPMPLDTRLLTWATLATVAVWLFITYKMRIAEKKERAEIERIAEPDSVCERFPDQCPCTTELGKGVA
jgi:ATP/ADP translocase